MIRSIIIPIALFFSILSTFSCLEDNPSNYSSFDESEGYAGVDARLWEYYQTFENEAAKRGLAVDLKTTLITGEIDNIHDNNVIGTCQYGRYVNNHITIDKSFWAKSSQLGKEFVVFHELGHCFLNRSHLEDSTSGGLCVSLMRSGNGSCRDAYSFQNREYYLNELFSFTGN